MGLQSKVSALVQRSSGNSANDSARIRSADKPQGADIANAFDNHQRQIDSLKNALTKNPELEDLIVADTDGSLIGWIGDRVVGGISYIGAYFRRIWIGGTGPADANIVADATGISINGAGITLTKNGVTTTINNTIAGSDSDVESLKSEDIATGDYSYVNPAEFQVDVMVSGTPETVAIFGQAGQAGRIALKDAAGLTLIQASGGASGHPFIRINDAFTNTATFNATGISSTGTAGNFQLNTGGLTLSVPLATTSGGTGSNYANFAALVAAIEAAFGGVSGSITVLTGFSTSSTVIDYLDHSSNPQSATVLTGVSATNSTIIFSNGIRTT